MERNEEISSSMLGSNLFRLMHVHSYFNSSHECPKCLKADSFVLGNRWLAQRHEGSNEDFGRN